MAGGWHGEGDDQEERDRIKQTWGLEGQEVAIDEEEGSSASLPLPAL